MKLKYIKIEQINNYFNVYFTDDFYTYTTPFYHNESYFNIMYRIFGLLPQDFYHFIGTTYHATFEPCFFMKNVILMHFPTKKDAELFASEADKRLTYFINRGDFT